jgi:hypothetical protein
MVCGLLHTMPAQTPYGAKPYKGPRALGLIELPAKGKPHVVPIAILVNGQFYDASAYKADPVPMALWSETVYEGFKTGVSQGLFTVTTAMENPKTSEWIAEGTWQSADALAKLKAEPKRHESSIPRGMDDDEGPPVLRHSGAKKPTPPPATPPSSTSTTNSPPAPSQPKPAVPPQTSASVSTPPAPPEEDPNIPVLRRGKPTPKPEEPLQTSASPSPAKPTAKPSVSAATAKPSVQIFAAISDSGGPESRPYAYQASADQEKQFREKMLAVAGDEIAARAKKLAAELGSPPAAHASTHRARKASGPQPQFQDVQLRVFDLSYSNEPVLVLSANAHMPQASNEQGSLAHLQYSITLVEREDINGDFHKIFSEVTDSDHLDVLPRYELIDAVDADGDGRGELLFQQISDDGSTFGIYRVIGDQLYPLFQTAP